MLHPAATVVLYTDGLLERQTVQEMADLPLEELCDLLLSAVGDVEDDIALLAVRAHSEDEARPPELGRAAPRADHQR